VARRDIALNINKTRYELKVSTTSSLAEILREQIGLTGTKVMCNEGECGACTVILDGKPALSCMMLAVDCEGQDILTIEGLSDPLNGKIHPLQEVFIQRSGMQCGVCTPGMILTAACLLEENPDPTEDEVREGLSGNLCRCGNYQRITECVLEGAKIMRTGGRDGK